MNLTGGFWGYASHFDINKAGFLIVGGFVGIWVAALALWRFGKIEDRWHAAADRSRIARGERPDAVAAGIEVAPLALELD